MGNRIEERIPAHKMGLARLLDKQIEVLETGGDLKSVFDPDELRELGTGDHAEYLAELKEMRYKLGQPDDGSEE